MSKARKYRRAREWARYFNHYSHIPDVHICGWAGVRYVRLPGAQWRYVRSQAKHAFMDGYRGTL